MTSKELFFISVLRSDTTILFQFQIKKTEIDDMNLRYKTVVRLRSSLRFFYPTLELLSYTTSPYFSTFSPFYPYTLLTSHTLCVYKLVSKFLI